MEVNLLTLKKRGKTVVTLDSILKCRDTLLLKILKCSFCELKGCCNLEKNIEKMLDDLNSIELILEELNVLDTPNETEIFWGIPGEGFVMYERI